MITVEVDGNNYDQFISIEMGMSLSALARDFNLTVSQPEGAPLPFVGGENVKIFIDGQLRLNGFIFKVNPRGSKDDHTVSMFGRSLVADLLDSSLLPISLAPDMSLKKAIEIVIDQLNGSIKVINLIPDLENFRAEEDKINSEPGEGAFSFIDRLARKRQVLLISDENGNILITRNGSAQNPVTLFNPVKGRDGNIKDFDINYNQEDRFHKYIVMSQGNASTNPFAQTFTPETSVDQRAEKIDKDVRNTRQKVILSEKSSTNDELLARACWEANIARVNSRDYSVIVQGTRPKGGDIWEMNRLQKVIDNQSGISEVMLIDSVRFFQSKGQGTVTKLGLVEKDAYSIILSQPIPSEEMESGFALFS